MKHYDISPGQYVVITKNLSAHGYERGQVCIVESLPIIAGSIGLVDEVSNNMRYLVIADEIEALHENKANINADIHAALRQSSLSEFNRVSDYEGGGYVMPEYENSFF